MSSPTSHNGTAQQFTGSGRGARLHHIHQTAASSGAALVNGGSHKAQAATTNGASSPYNPYSGFNLGAPPDDPFVGLDRVQVTRLIIQALSTTYPDVAEHLSRASGCEVADVVVQAFQEAVVGGQWADAEEIIFGAAATEDDQPRSNGLVLMPGADPSVMVFEIKRQKYLELMELGLVSEALDVLRLELTPLCDDTQQLSALSALLMCSTPDELRNEAEWEGAAGGSRHKLWSKLAELISPSVMLPEHRLFSLLHDSLDFQRKSCRFHSARLAPTLYMNHTCRRDNFPSHLAVELTGMDSEVWKVEFSHDGTRLAACGLGNQLVIWDVATWRVAHILKAHRDGVTNFAWSPDDTRIVTCSLDHRARIWRADDGTLLKSLDKVDETLTGCAWNADGMAFTTSSFDKNRGLRTYSADGQLLFDWGLGRRVQDFAQSPDGKLTATVDHTAAFHLWDTHRRELLYQDTISARATSVAFSNDGAHVLINDRDGRAVLFNLDTKAVDMEFSAHAGGKFQVRAAFGGPDEDYVACGSHDGHAYVYHRHSGQLTLKLEHEPVCNSVAWNPRDPTIFASGGDDGKVKIWANKATAEQIQKRRHRSVGSSC